MAEPGQIDIKAHRRTPYTEPWVFLDRDLTSWTLKMQVRLVKDTTGTPLLEETSGAGVSANYAGTATVAAHVAAGRLDGIGDDSIYSVINPATGVHYVGGDSLTMSVVDTYLNCAGLPIPGDGIGGETGDDLSCWYDLIGTPPGGGAIPVMLLEGRFTVLAGSTIP